MNKVADAVPACDAPVSLCLSGGGYRAALFHLGALRWLNQTGVLARLATISSVSGGSIIAAHLAKRLIPWPIAPLSEDEWESRVVEPFRAFVKNDIRTTPVLTRLLPTNWFDSASTVEAVRKKYARLLLGGDDTPLASLEKTPKFVFCSTDMVFGINWEASRSRVGDYEAGYAQPPPLEWTLARAVAASSCFPPVFPPARTRLRPDQLRYGSYRDPDRNERVAAIRLTDGGVYDNLGLQPVIREPVVLVSDGGGQMAFSLLNRPWRRLARYPALLQQGIGKLRKSWLMMDYMRKDTDPSRKLGTYWGIADYKADGLPVEQKHIAQRIANIRTDLNRFTDAEIEILINHGYLRAADKMMSKAGCLLPAVPTPVEVPYAKWTDTGQLKKALRHSHKRMVMFREKRSSR